MTNEEAIEVIKEYRDNLINSPSNQLDGDIKAFDMAIQSLSSWEEYSDKLWKKAYERGKTEAYSRLEQIRTEIAEYKDDKIIHAEQNEMIDIMLDIIDKCKAESEE